MPDSADRERSSGALFLKKHIKLHSSSSNWLTDAAYLNHGFVPSSLSPSESGWGRSVGTQVLERSNHVCLLLEQTVIGLQNKSRPIGKSNCNLSSTIRKGLLPISLRQHQPENLHPTPLRWTGARYFSPQRCPS
ncbi:hypothetical protein C8R48DRAFT_225426 [Suillus tomentosus]|nr:hypothetical protein C8R48DRAFT_225426 [Suillus tomentosus]